MKGTTSCFLRTCLVLMAVLIGSGCVAKSGGNQGAQPLQASAPATQEKSSTSTYNAKKTGKSRYSTLAELTDDLCDDLYKDIGEKKIFLDRENILDASENDVSNFSGYLEQEIDSSCSLKGFSLVYDLDDADFLIGVLYRRYRDDLRVFLKYHPVDMSSKKSLDYRISKSVIPPDSFTNSMKYKARKLARQIAKGQDGKKIYVKPVVEGNNLYVSDFSKAFTARVKNEIVREYREVIVIDYRSTRSIKKMKKTGNLADADVAATGADIILSGQYFLEGDIVAVHLNLQSREDGRLLNSAGIDIAREDISSRLEDKEAEVLATVVDLKEETYQEMVKLSTTRGSDYPIYKNGEKIVFTMQTREPLYVYLYNCDPAGEITMLYPFEKRAQQSSLLSNKVYKIPPSNSYEFIVEPPFGREGLKLFAARHPIPFPVIAISDKRARKRSIGVRRKNQQVRIANAQRISHQNDLVDYYRGIGRQMGMKIFEDSFILETRRR